jgi:orotate phosphoribosyltransferase
MSAKFRTGYLDRALYDLPTLLRDARKTLVDVDFDTIVGTGFSGGLVVPTLAMRLKKKFVLIRKENDDSHHGSGRLIGELGERWLFVDDFVSSGATKRRVIDKIQLASIVEDINTVHVGSFYYAACDATGKLGNYAPEEES